MEITTTIALITGVSGFIASIGTILLGFFKQRSENKKGKSDQVVDATVAALNIVNSASELREMYEKSLDECKESNRKIEEKLILVDAKLLEHEKTIAKISSLNKRYFNILSKWIKGINLLLDQIRSKNFEPVWFPDDDDLKTLQNI